MDPMEIVEGVVEQRARAPGSDSERRTAVWLGRRLRALGREVVIEPEWVRPQWPLVHAVHAVLGTAGGLLVVSQPIPGLVVLAVALVSSALDLLGGAHLVRRLTPERATQNLVSPPTAATASGAHRVVRLVIVAHYDAPRGGLARRAGATQVVAGLQRLAGGRFPGALGTLPVAIAGLLVAGIARLAGIDAFWLDIAQLLPTLWLLGGLAAVVDIGLAPTAPGAGEPASGAAVAVALAAALDRAPPRHLAVELVLAGAGCGPSLGMRAFVARRRRRYAPVGTAVLHVASCGRGRPAWWTVDGPLLSRRLHPELAARCAEVARERPELGARPHRGHGSGAAWRARLAGWPAVTVGCLDRHGSTPGLGRADDELAALDRRAMRDALLFCRALVDRLDADLGRRPREATTPPPPR